MSSLLKNQNYLRMESTCHEMVINRFKRFSCMNCSLFAFFINKCESERMIARAREVSRNICIGGFKKMILWRKTSSYGRIAICLTIKVACY